MNVTMYWRRYWFGSVRREPICDDVRFSGTCLVTCILSADFMAIRRSKCAVITLALALGSSGIQRTNAFVYEQIRTSTHAQFFRECHSSSHCCSSMSSKSSGAHAGPIILGSKSFTRKAILEKMAFTPIIRTADIDEAAIGDRTSDPRELVLELGLAKAKALLPVLKAEAERGTLGAVYLLTADQVVVHEGRILEKPADEEEVRRNIAGYAISPCRTVGSAVLTNVLTGEQVSGVDTAEVSFAEIPETVVAQLCREGTVFRCAGGLMVEHEMVQPFILKIDGTIDSVMGLSKSLVLKLLDQLSPRTAPT